MVRCGGPMQESVVGTVPHLVPPPPTHSLHGALKGVFKNDGR